MPTIVVADDCAVSRRVLSYQLRQEGYQVLLASDGMAALALCATQPVDLSVSDMDMPGMDGITLTREMWARYPQRPLIMVMASSDPALQTDAINAGATAYLTKPVSTQMLLTTVLAVAARTYQGAAVANRGSR